jgi:hypothetical protein
MTPTEYEKAVVERFRTYWPPPRYVVKHDIRLPGKKTNARRQIDISVFEAGQSVPILIAEAKRQGRPVDAVKAGSTIALVQDVGGVPAVMVSTSGFSLAAENHLAVEPKTVSPTALVLPHHGRTPIIVERATPAYRALMLEIERRRQQVGLTCWQLEDAAGLNDGHFSHLLHADRPSGRQGSWNAYRRIVSGGC